MLFVSKLILVDAIGNQKLFFQRMDGVHPYGGHLLSPEFLFSGNYPIPLIHMFLQCHHGQLTAIGWYEVS